MGHLATERPFFYMALIEKIFNPISAFHHKRISRYLKELDIDECDKFGKETYLDRIPTVIIDIGMQKYLLIKITNIMF